MFEILQFANFGELLTTRDRRERKVIFSSFFWGKGLVFRGDRGDKGQREAAREDKTKQSDETAA